MTNSLNTRFRQSAEIFPHLLDVPSDQVLLSQLSEADYRAASFLDQRIITPQLQRQTVPWSVLSGITVDAPRPLFIFHIGHVGSTLISRLLGEHKDILALREPPLLRTFAELSLVNGEPHAAWSPQKFSSRLDQSVTWLSRSFHPEQRVMIKASSFVSEISGRLITPQTKALFLFARLPQYLSTIFAGDGSRQEASMLAGQRLERLHRRLGGHLANLWDLSEGQKIALGWLCEMTSLMETFEGQNGNHILWQDFDAFLDARNPSLVTISKHFGYEFSETEAEMLTSGPIMRQYSKAPEHEYSPQLRRDLLAQARGNFAAEIDAAIAWVKLGAKQHKLIETVLTFSETSDHV